jgi:hypothetical protein
MVPNQLCTESLHSRASLRAAAGSPNHRPGGISDNTALLTLAFSMSAKESSTDHLGGGPLTRLSPIAAK